MQKSSFKLKNSPISLSILTHNAMTHLHQIWRQTNIRKITDTYSAHTEREHSWSGLYTPTNVWNIFKKLDSKNTKIFSSYSKKYFWIEYRVIAKWLILFTVYWSNFDKQTINQFPMKVLLGKEQEINSIFDFLEIFLLLSNLSNNLHWSRSTWTIVTISSILSKHPWW